MSLAFGNFNVQLRQVCKRQIENLINFKLFSLSSGTKFMVTNGVSNLSVNPWVASNKTEIGDVLNGESCVDLADFPENIYDAAYTNFHDGTPVVCGGAYLTTYYQKCYKFTNFGWQEFASMKEKRAHAAGCMYKDKFHIFGGGDATTFLFLNTSEIISIDGVVEYGPDLPTYVFAHKITAINATVSILSGGITSTDSYTAATWYYNHETAVFSSGPSLLEGRRNHGSTTIMDTVTKAKIVVVTGGFNVTNMKSTELLINGQWQQGTI